MGRERLEIEFGSYLSWVVEAIEAVAPDQVSGACRGLGSPRLLEEVLRAGTVRPGARVLDCGCGLGGPAAWFARNGYEVVAVDVMEAAVAGAARLFPDLPVARGSWRFLPFPDDSFDAVTALGVLELVERKASCFRETKRVLRPDGTAVIYDYVASAADIAEVPAANRFVTHDDLRELAAAAGLEVLVDRAIELDEITQGPWQEIGRAVEQAVDAAHAGDPALAAARREKALFQELRREGTIAPRLMVVAA